MDENTVSKERTHIVSFYPHDTDYYHAIWYAEKYPGCTIVTPSGEEEIDNNTRVTLENLVCPIYMVSPMVQRGVGMFFDISYALKPGVPYYFSNNMADVLSKIEGEGELYVEGWYDKPALQGGVKLPDTLIALKKLPICLVCATFTKFYWLPKTSEVKFTMGLITIEERMEIGIEALTGNYVHKGLRYNCGIVTVEK